MFLSIDVGNSRLKLAAFSAASAASVLPESTVTVAGDPSTWPALDKWLEATWPDDKPSCWISSVQRTVSGRLLEHLERRHHIARAHTLTFEDFPLQVDVRQPELVGVDRLAAALAAHRLAESNRAAIVVDLGSAITVDRISAEGHFEGGAILAGVDMAAEALHRRTEALPHVDVRSGDDVPVVPGTSTEEAIAAGLYWGAVGGVRELVARLARDVKPEPAVFVTGGAAAQLTSHLGDTARYEPDLVLRGVALAAAHLGV